MADDANKRGDTPRTLELTRAAETIATQLVTVEREIEDLKTLALASSQAADQRTFGFFGGSGIRDLAPRLSRIGGDPLENPRRHR